MSGKLQTPNFFDAQRIHLIINKMTLSSQKKKEIYINKNNQRDLKPENLLLDVNKDIKIVDFGLSTICRFATSPTIFFMGSTTDGITLRPSAE